MQLRRLTRFSRLELEKEQAELQEQIAALEEILGDEQQLRKVVSDELAEVAKAYGNPRRTVLLQSAGQPSATAVPLEVSRRPLPGPALLGRAAGPHHRRRAAR